MVESTSTSGGLGTAIPLDDMTRKLTLANPDDPSRATFQLRAAPIRSS